MNQTKTRCVNNKLTELPSIQYPRDVAREMTKVEFVKIYGNQITLKIGIDFGGVLSIHDGQDVEHKNTSLNMPRALEALTYLKRNGHKLYLISFAEKTRSQETQDSINETCPDIFDGLYFVKDKSFKKDVCEFLGCDIMIDDREDILEMFEGKGAMHTIPVLFSNVKEYVTPTTKISILHSWSEKDLHELLNWITTLVTHSNYVGTPNLSIDLSKKVYQLKDKVL